MKELKKEEKEELQKEVNEILKAEITFTIGKADIKPEGRKTVENVAAVMSKYPDQSFLVEGHTDCGTKCSANKPCKYAKLADDRAANVVSMLRDCGCKNNFDSKGWGCRHPEVGLKAKVRISAK